MHSGGYPSSVDLTPKYAFKTMDESTQNRLGGTGHKPTRGKVFMLDG